jgi:DNA-binding response OmpR family regulator
MEILIAEDEEDLRFIISNQLREEGYEVFEAADGMQALEIFRKQEIHIGLFDIMMPKLDGISLMKKIRESSNIPIIFLTARGYELDKVTGLNMGADDYIVKPFSMDELMARIAVQARRVIEFFNINLEEDKVEDKIICGEIEYNKLTGNISKSGEELKLNTKEYLLLIYLLENKNILLTKQQIYASVWNEEYMYEDNTVMVHICRIRNKIEDNPKQPKYLMTFKGIGYKLIDN